MDDSANPFPTEEEIQFLAMVSKQMLGLERLGALLETIDPADSFRMQPLTLCLKQAREANGWTVKLCAEALSVRQKDLRSFEAGHLERSHAERFGRYVAFLGLEKVYSQWVEANQSYVRRLGLPESAPARAMAWPEPVSFIVLPGQFRLPPGFREEMMARLEGMQQIMTGQPLSLKRRPANPSPAVSAALPAVYQIKVTLKHVQPKVWRRILVSNEITLHQLHNVLQAAMGWYNCHLHEFRLREQRFAIPQPEIDFGEDALDERSFRLRDLGLAPASKLRYEYDFGDGWDHELLLEKVLPLSPDFLPVCLKGTGACPPEDSGGPWGYAQKLEALVNPNHPEHEEIASWIGPNFDPESFDLETVNARLAANARQPKTRRRG